MTDQVSGTARIYSATLSIWLASERELDLEMIMPWTLRFAIGSLLVFIIGAAMIAWACMSTGWETLSRFAWGCLTAGAGLIATTLFTMLSAIIHKSWRRFSLALMIVSVLLFLGLLIFAKFA
jgi:hypothetical protein